MEAFVVLGAVAIGFKIGNTMSNPDNYPKRRRKRMKKYIVYYSA